MKNIYTFTLAILLISNLSFAQGVIWEEDFESNTIPSDWTTVNASGGNGTTDWSFGTGDFPWSDYDSWNMDNNAAIFSDFTPDETSHNNRMLLRTEGVDVTGYTNLKVKMQVSLRTSGSYGSGALSILIYDSGWLQLAYYDGDIVNSSNIEINLSTFLDAHPNINVSDIRLGFKYDDLGHGITYGAGIGWVKITGNPSNDDCSTAVNVVIPEETYALVDDQHLRGATNNNGGIDACQNNQFDGIWYTFTPTQSWDMYVSVFPDNFWNPHFEVYTGSCGNFNCVNGTFNTTTNNFYFSVTAGTQYWLNISDEYTTDYTNFYQSSFDVFISYKRPENDERYFPYSINEFPYSNTQSMNATTNNDEAATNGFVTICAPGMNDGVWYSFYAHADGEINIEAQASQVDLEIGLYELTDPNEEIDFSNYSCVGSVDSTLTGASESLTAQVEEGKRYSINLGDYSYTTNHQEEGDLTINVYYSQPVNNDCQNAIELTNNQTLDGSTGGATNDFTNTCGNTTDDLGVWYHYTSQYGGIVALWVNSLPNYSYSKKLAVFTGDCNNLSCSFNIHNDNPYSEFETQIGEEYYIYVSTNNQYISNFSITADNIPPQNDEATGALEIPVNYIGTTCSSPTMIYNANGVTDSSPINGTPSCASFAGGDSWYKFIAPTSGGIKINRPNSGDWGALGYAIYDSPTSTTPLTCNYIAYANTNTESDPYTGLTAGNYYWLRIWEWSNNDYGSVGICLEEVDTMGLDDLKALGFEYYPNPVNDMLQLSAKENIDQIIIYNTLGQELIKSSPASTNTSLDVSNLIEGTYYVKAIINDHIGSFKIIKQ